MMTNGLTLETVLLFSGAVMLLLLSPGPNMALVVGHGAALGWRGGLAAATGIALADLAMTVLTAAGVAAVFSSEPARRWLHVAAAGYLLYLAWQSWVRPPRFVSTQASQAELAVVVRRAALNSLLNPKSLLFFMAFLPSFADAQAPLGPQILVLGLLLTAIALAFHVLLSMVGTVVARTLASHRTHRLDAVVAGRLLALLFAALAVRLMLSW